MEFFGDLNCLENDFNVVQKIGGGKFMYFSSLEFKDDKLLLKEMLGIPGGKFKTLKFSIFSLDCRTLTLCFSDDVIVSFMSLKSGSEIKVINGGKFVKLAMKVILKPIAMKNGRMLVYDFKKGELCVWLMRSLESEKERRAFCFEKGERIERYSWSRDEELLLVGLKNFEIKLFDKSLTFKRKFLYTSFGNLFSLRGVSSSSWVGIASNKRKSLGINFNKEFLKVKPKSCVFKNGSLLLFEKEEKGAETKEKIMIFKLVLRKDKMRLEEAQLLNFQNPNLFYYSNDKSIVFNNPYDPRKLGIFCQKKLSVLKVDGVNTREGILGFRRVGKGFVVLVGEKIVDRLSFFTGRMKRVQNLRVIRLGKTEEQVKGNKVIVKENPIFVDGNREKTNTVLENREKTNTVLEKRVEEIEETQKQTNLRLNNIENLISKQMRVLSQILKNQENNKTNKT